MSSLPNEIYLEILSKVSSSESLLICKCVCKNWHKLISDPAFVKMHLNVAENNKNNYSLILKSSQNESVYYMSYDSLASLISSNGSDAAVELKTPLKYFRTGESRFLGSCHGLVYGWNHREKFFFLWNPATRDYRRLPKSNTDGISGYHSLFYDSQIDSYLLVSIEEGGSIFQVYSSKSDRWGSCSSGGRFLSEYPCGMSGVFLNGALHWLVRTDSKDDSKVLFTLEISKDTFKELPLPTTTRGTFTSVEVLEGRLCVLASTKETLQLWVMGEYGVPESWVKLRTITFKSMGLRRGSYCEEYIKLMGSLVNGEILFMGGELCYTSDTAHKYIILYNPKSKTVRKVNIRSLCVDTCAISYFESLVSINSDVVRKGKKREITGNLKKI